MISAACHHVIFFAIARKMTSWIFIARSTADGGYSRILPPPNRMPRLPSRLKRTDHVLIHPDTSHANDKPRNEALRVIPGYDILPLQCSKPTPARLCTLVTGIGASLPSGRVALV